MIDAGRVDAVVIGAGVVGLACARLLAADGVETVLLEAADAIGTGASSRNSEVIHAGIYYPPDSLKARLCIEGRERLLDYCALRGVGHRLCGKLVVATQPAERPVLAGIAAQAARCGVQLDSLSAAALRELEPELEAVAALWSPGTGIVDSHGLIQALAADVEACGGLIALATPVRGMQAVAGGWEVVTGGSEPARLRCRWLVNAAGLAADRLAAELASLPPVARVRHHFARGRWYAYHAPVPFRRLIYPVPVPGGLGIHLTLDLSGRARFGPDVEFVRGADLRFDDSVRDDFARSIRRYWPGLDPDRLAPDQCGIRPRLGGPGQRFADFRIDGPALHGLSGLVNLFGIESPGLTASLAIAERVRACLLV